MDDERRKNLNYNVAQEALDTFLGKELAQYVLSWLQMRPVKLDRHRIGLVEAHLQLVRGELISSRPDLCRTRPIKISQSLPCFSVVMKVKKENCTTSLKCVSAPPSDQCGHNGIG